MVACCAALHQASVQPYECVQLVADHLKAAPVDLGSFVQLRTKSREFYTDVKELLRVQVDLRPEYFKAMNTEGSAPGCGELIKHVDDTGAKFPCFSEETQDGLAVLSALEDAQLDLLTDSYLVCCDATNTWE